MPSILEKAFLTSALIEELALHASSDQSQDNSRQVNYIWLNNAEQKEKGHILGIPPEQLQRALQNADRYPDVDFHIWLDFDNLDPDIRNSLANNPCPFVNERIAVRDLNEIPDYQVNLLTQPDIDIGVRSDMVRLQVLSHTLATDSHSETYYSDMDVHDIKIDHPEIRDTMQKYGANLGLTWLSDLDEAGYENGYMGFRRGFGSAFLNDYIRPASQDVMHEPGEGYNTGEVPIIMLFIALQEKVGAQAPLGIEVLEESGTKIDPVSKEALYPFLNPSHQAVQDIVSVQGAKAQSHAVVKFSPNF